MGTGPQNRLRHLSELVKRPDEPLWPPEPENERLESPIERTFARALYPRLHAEVTPQLQVPVQTICGGFILDLVVDCGATRVAFECDGKEFHDESRDEWRDAMILGAAAVDIIYRLRGTDIHHRVDDLVFIASVWNPELFSERGRNVARSLASEQVRTHPHMRNPDPWRRDLLYGENGVVLLSLERRLRLHKEGARGRYFWMKIFEFAQRMGGGDLDRVIRKFRGEE